MSTGDQGRDMRKRLLFAATIALAAVIAVSCAPEGPPIDEPALPDAPRMGFPTPLPDGTRAVVLHFGSEDDPETGGFYLVDEHSVEELDPVSERFAQLMSRAFGVTRSDGTTLVSWITRPLAIGLQVCASASSEDCRAVPGVTNPANYNFSPDGRFIAVVDSGGDGSPTLRIHDAESLELVTEAPTGHAGAAAPIPWSPDSSTIALLVSDAPFPPHLLSTLEAAPGAAPTVVVPREWGTGPMEPLRWSDDGRLIYQAVDNVAGEVRHTVRSVPADGSEPPIDIAESHQGDHVVALSDGTVLHSDSPPAGGRVPHHAGTGLVSRPLAVPECWTDGSGPRCSTTYVLAVLEPGE